MRFRRNSSMTAHRRVRDAAWASPPPRDGGPATSGSALEHTGAAKTRPNLIGTKRAILREISA